MADLTIAANVPRRKISAISIAGATSSGFYVDYKKQNWLWGSGANGALGQNNILDYGFPVSLKGNRKTFCNISMGASCGMGIDQNGKVWVWGSNDQGKLGINSIINQSTPVAIGGGLKTFCSISTNKFSSHSSGLDKNGRAWCWGQNGAGQLGDNTRVAKSTPISVLGAVKTFCKIFAGFSHTLSIDKNGIVWAWGANGNAQLGINTIGTDALTPTSIRGATKTFSHVDAGSRFSAGIDKNGQAWTWGENNFGQLGRNDTTQRSTPVSVCGTVKTFCKISTGNDFVLAIDKNGKIWGWGRNDFGQLGDNTQTNRLTPINIVGTLTNKTFCQIVASGSLGLGTGWSLAIQNNGKIWAWGHQNFNLGIGIRFNSPLQICGPTTRTFCKVGAAFYNSAGIDQNGNLFTWGDNRYGCLGINSTTSEISPKSISGAAKTFCSIAGANAGTETFFLGLDKNGRLWSWGNNTYGQLGDNSTVSKRTPVSVAGAVKTFCKIYSEAQSYGHNGAIDKNGRVWMWGYNLFGALGDNTSLSKNTPVSILGAIKTFCKISLGESSTMAIDKNGRLWGWGSNFNGYLGDNSITNRFTPVSVLGAVKTFCQIASGNYHTFAIDKNGQLWSWGANNNGVLGRNNIGGSFRTPVSVLGAVKTFCKVTSGPTHGLAIDKNGVAWGWGLNLQGQLGDNSNTNRSTPVRVAGNKTFCEITTSESATIAIDNRGITWAWGRHYEGELGIGFTTKTPMKVIMY